MTDIDQLLADDGARWRAVQPAVPEPDPALFARPRRPRWQPIAAAAAAVVIAAGAVTVATLRHAPAATPAARTESPIVHDGDLVTGQGWLIAVPGEPVRMCTTRRSIARLDSHTGRQGPDFPGVFDMSLKVYTGHSGYCANGLTVVGADLHRLAFRFLSRGTVSGQIELTGVYRDGTVTVTEQQVPGVLARYFPITVPADCPVPAGGWPRAIRTAREELHSVQEYVDADPHVLGAMAVRFPRQWDPAKPVLLVTTTGDVGEATRAVRARFAGALCVRAVPHSRAQALAAWVVIHRALGDATTAARYGLIGGDQTVDASGDPRAGMTVLVWTDKVDSLRRSAGDGVVDVDPLLRKVG